MVLAEQVNQLRGLLHEARKPPAPVGDQMMSHLEHVMNQLLGSDISESPSQQPSTPLSEPMVTPSASVPPREEEEEEEEGKGEMVENAVCYEDCTRADSSIT